MSFRGALSTVRARLYLGFALLLAMILLPASVVAYESYRIAEVNLERQVRAADLHQRVDDLQIDPLNMETGKRGSVLYVRRGVISPLQKLREGATMVGEGDLGHRIDLRSRDELGAVAAEIEVGP